MKTKLTLFVTVLAAALLGVGCATTASGADKPTYVHGFKGFGKEGLWIHVIDTTAKADVKAIEEQVWRQLLEVGMVKRRKSNHDDYLQIYLYKSPALLKTYPSCLRLESSRGRLFRGLRLFV